MDWTYLTLFLGLNALVVFLGGIDAGIWLNTIIAIICILTIMTERNINDKNNH